MLTDIKLSYMLPQNSINYVLAVKNYNAGLKDKISALFKEFGVSHPDWVIDDGGHSVDIMNRDNESENLIVDIYNGGILEIHGDYPNGDHPDSMYSQDDVQYYQRIEFELEDDQDAIVGKVVASISDMYERRAARFLTKFVSEKYLNQVNLSHFPNINRD